jgi:hypothetical protein
MTAKHRKYKPERDFLRVRDLLANTYPAFEKPVNWRIERWNYARYLVAPFLGPDRTTNHRPEDSIESIHIWEDTIGVWENDENDIVGVVCAEYPWPGETFFQRHPRYDLLLDEMIRYAEETLLSPTKNCKKRRITVRIWISLSLDLTASVSPAASSGTMNAIGWAFSNTWRPILISDGGDSEG